MLCRHLEFDEVWDLGGLVARYGFDLDIFQFSRFGSPWLVEEEDARLVFLAILPVLLERFGSWPKIRSVQVNADIVTLHAIDDDGASEQLVRLATCDSSETLVSLRAVHEEAVTEGHMKMMTSSPAKTTTRLCKV